MPENEIEVSFLSLSNDKIIVASNKEKIIDIKNLFCGNGKAKINYVGGVITIPTSESSYIAIPAKKDIYFECYVGERHTFNFKAIKNNVEKKKPTIIVARVIDCMSIEQATKNSDVCIAVGDTDGYEVLINELNEQFITVESRLNVQFIILYSCSFPKENAETLKQLLMKNGYPVAISDLNGSYKKIATTKSDEKIVRGSNKEKCVYILEMNNDTVKIGITQNLSQRLNTISTASGLEILKSCHSCQMPKKMARKIENALHKKFAQFRTKGEFFKISFDEACLELQKYTDIK